MIHVNVIIVHQFINELILLLTFSYLSNAITVTILLDLNTVHLHFESIMHMSNVIPGTFNQTCVNKVEFLMHIKTTVIDPKVIVTIERKFRSQSIGSSNIGSMLIRKHN